MNVVPREQWVSNTAFAREELERRRKAPVLVKAEEIEAQREQNNQPYIVDPRLGFNQKWFRLWIRRGNRGLEGQRTEGWGLGHRHTVEAVIYIMKGKGFSLIDGVKHPWEAGDFVCVPFFAWHKHFVETEDEELIHMACTTNPFGLATGLAIYEDEREPEHWVYAQEGNEAMRTLVPGGHQAAERKVVIEQSQWRPKERSDGGEPTPADIYWEDLGWAQNEEKRRREAKVVARWKELRWDHTPMGRMAYVVHPRLGFYTKILSTAVGEVPPGKRSGAHRHIYEETNYVLQGEGYAIVEDSKYEFKKGDVLVIPVFAWHQYFNTGKEPALFISHTNRIGVQNTGYAHTQQGEPADY